MEVSVEKADDPFIMSGFAYQTVLVDQPAVLQRANETSPAEGSGEVVSDLS